MALIDPKAMAVDVVQAIGGDCGPKPGQNKLATPIVAGILEPRRNAGRHALFRIVSASA
ncbi:hypothetical protein OHA98_42450 [Streptomyces sp. NBC_00654]|uniref:hypothetical protein n=1 Tax=Streptomyces sp. NBC_00654 TaxID=2975799 RepID=UPI0022510AE2|nr:hypothetical protein [Streptomyces sp. NBC_00654]MCX4971263.1 hypothetical protein [Streptomyces sp. NBC_00654]